MALIAVAESAQDIASGFNKFLDPVPEISTEITALISECYAISSALREINTAKDDQRYCHEFDLIYTDVSSVRQSLDYTFRDVLRLFAGLGRTTHISKRAAYNQVWREIDSHFYQESHSSLCKRLEYNRLYLSELTCILIDGRPSDDHIFWDLQDRTAELLRKQEARLESTFNHMSLGDPGANRQRSFERRRPPGLFTQAPEPPPALRGGARRPGPMSPQSPPGFDDYPFGPPAPDVKLVQIGRPIRGWRIASPTVPSQFRPASQDPLPGFTKRTVGEAMLLAINIAHDPEARVNAEALPGEQCRPREGALGVSTLPELRARIVDDHYEHALRVFRDRDCGGIRLQASVLTGELKRKPVWTAFITTHIESQRWMRRADPRTIHLADLQQYIFSTEYNPQLGPVGQHELRFTSSKDADDFMDRIDDLADDQLRRGH
ncbi:MAG: hypothetical protein Q9218_004105 [Villophora microphyllina]